MAAGIEERVATLEREMGEMRKIVILGNGKPSLVEQVATIGTELKDIKASLARLNNGISRVVWLVLSSVIGQILYAVFQNKG